MTVTIRLARPDDAAALRAVEQQSFDARYGAGLSVRSFRHFAGAPSASMAVATDAAGAVLGYALLLFRRGARAARLYSIAVPPAGQGRGIGRALLDWAEGEAVRRAATRMILEVRPDNAASLAWYRRRGYRPFRTETNYYPDGGSALRLQRAIGEGEQSA